MNEATGNRQKKRKSGKASTQFVSPAKPQDANRELDALRRGAISAFILFHLVAIACVAVPVKALTGAKDLFMPYMRWSGLFQSWDMFAPDPQAVNSYVKAVVITQDHHIKVWSFPRMEELSFWDRFREERYRKFAEVLPQPQLAPLWPDVARHIARLMNNHADPPDKVLLIEFQSEIHPGTANQAEPAPRPNVFYDDYLQPGDLQ
jgi:hypothetical protein